MALRVAQGVAREPSAKGSKGDAGANSPTPTPPLVGENCYQLKQQGNTANGEYTLTIVSRNIVVCGVLRHDRVTRMWGPGPRVPELT